MPCKYPHKVYRVITGKTDSGSWPITWDKNKGDPKQSAILIPCGKCISCKLEYSRQWAIRCVHEAKMHKENCFLTLTYKEDQKSLNKRDIVLFLKRLRKYVEKNCKSKIRFFQCGEYGEQFKRPHHHVAIFGFTPSDKKLWAIRNGVRLYRSATIENLWPYGYSTVGDVNFDSAAYISRYVTKKITGEKAVEHYSDREPEYLTMSRRPGIGTPFLKKYGSDIKNYDTVVIRNGLTCRPPRYYDNIYDQDELKIVKQKRRAKIDLTRDTPDRRIVKNNVLQLNLKKMKRGLESDYAYI